MQFSFCYDILREQSKKSAMDAALDDTKVWLASTINYYAPATQQPLLCLYTAINYMFAS